MITALIGHRGVGKTALLKRLENDGPHGPANATRHR
jgi:ABC-type phosphate/phosphonate transport system ATPase subunit